MSATPVPGAKFATSHITVFDIDHQNQSLIPKQTLSLDGMQRLGCTVCRGAKTTIGIGYTLPYYSATQLTATVGRATVGVEEGDGEGQMD